MKLLPFRRPRCHPDCAVVVELVAVLRTPGPMTQMLQNQAPLGAPVVSVLWVLWVVDLPFCFLAKKKVPDCNETWD